MFIATTLKPPASRRASNHCHCPPPPDPPIQHCPSSAPTMLSIAPGVLRCSGAPLALRQPGLVLLCNLGRCRFSSNGPPHARTHACTHSRTSRDLTRTNRTCCGSSPDERLDGVRRVSRDSRRLDRRTPPRCTHGRLKDRLRIDLWDYGGGRGEGVSHQRVCEQLLEARRNSLTDRRSRDLRLLQEGTPSFHPRYNLLVRLTTDPNPPPSHSHTHMWVLCCSGQKVGRRPGSQLAPRSHACNLDLAALH